MIQRPKGTKDILPQDSCLWQYMEKQIKNLFEVYGFNEIRVPVFEHTELFQRGVGDTTDVVQKEMYTFEDKGGRSITLRPEGTAGVVRAYIENGMASKPSPVKMWYNMGMYRYENVQKGRLREFHQIGVELIGSKSPDADIETISMAKRIFDKLEILNITLKLNSIGCPICREGYQKALKEFIENNIEKYCETCKTRLEKNPMRILDCKEKKCKENNQQAPIILDYLCEECKTHFQKVKEILTELGIPYKIDSRIVRGLDYYTKTVFEFIDEETGLTILGGGRYDGLIKQLEGQDTPAIGFAMGLERIADIIAKNEREEIKPKQPEIYVAQIGEKANLFATKLVEKLRQKGIYAVKDITEKSLKAQFKYADKIKAKYTLTIGEDEIKNGIGKIKNMNTGEEKEIDIKQCGRRECIKIFREGNELIYENSIN